MKLKLFDDKGYVNIPMILEEHPAIFIFIYGGRGTGKTYGFLQYVVDHNIDFMYLRRLASQVDLAKTDELQPFKTLNRDRNWTVQPFTVNKYIASFYQSTTNEDDKIIPIGDRLGFMTSLSTFSNLRGVDGHTIKLMCLDEFIPELNERPIKGEASALFNAYETINRNRELNGEAPLKLICLANSNRIDNPLFMELNLVRKAEKIRKDGVEYYYDSKRKMLLIDLYKSKISEEKSHTALYELTAGTEFYDMAIRNSFINEERGRIETRPIKEYKPLVSIGEITIYKHKSRKEYYCTTFRSGSPDSYTAGEKDKERFRKKYLYLWRLYMQRKIIFEEYMSEILFDNYFKK